MAFLGSDQSLRIIIKAKDEASKVIKQTEKTVNSFNKKVKDMQPAFSKMAIVGVASFIAVAAGAKKAIDKARDFEEETNKFSVVFKDVSKEAQNMADVLNESYGLSRLESKKLLSATGDILTGFGFTGDAALGLSGKVNTLAVDLASFTNAQGGAEAVSSALTKALLGERESLKTYGIAIQEADVQAELLAQGMDGLTGEALRQAKAQVTLDLAFRQSKNAVGDYARSNGTLTQTQKELKKATEDIQITIGSVLAPVYNQILKRIVPIIKATEKWVEENKSLVKAIIITAAAMSGLLAVFGGLGLALPKVIFLVKNFKTLLTGTNPILLALAIGVGWFTKKLIEFGDEVGGIGNAWALTVTNMEILFWKFVNSALEGFNKLAQFIPGLSGVITSSLDKVNQKVTEAEGRFTALVEAGIKPAEKAAEQTATALENLGAGGAAATKKVAKEMEELKEKIKDVNKEIAKLNIDSANATKNYNKEVLGSKEALAEAFVKQEQKVADLQEAIRGESSQKEIDRLNEQLTVEQGALESRRTIEIAHLNFVNEARRVAMLTDFEREVESIEKKKLISNLAFTEKLIQINKEIKEQERMRDELEIVEKQITATVKVEVGKREDVVVESMNRVIRKAQQMATAINQSFAGASTQMSSALNFTPMPNREHGGIVPGPRGTAVPIMAHGQERIIPANQAGGSGGGVTVIFQEVTFNGGESDREKVRKYVDDYFRPLLVNNKISA